MDGRKVIKTTEQSRISAEYSQELEDANWKSKSNGLYMAKPYCLGLKKVDDGFWTSYYIGACRINEIGKNLVVVPKLHNINFLKMFMEAVESKEAPVYFSMCYDIETDGAPIESNELYDILTPILVVHYVSVLRKVVKRGLMKGYMQIEENLKSKVKGHVLPMQNWRKNVLNKREDRFYCRYQEYTKDIPVNRLLKKAYTSGTRMIGNMVSLSSTLKSDEIKTWYNEINESFIGVSDNFELKEVGLQKYSKLNSEYYEAVRIAKMILKHYENNISEGETKTYMVQPFWIDMSRLFEMFVLKRLRQQYGKDILFQVQGHKAVADYIHLTEKVVIDAKYKLVYQNGYEIDDIREISGNARDRKICRHFKTDIQGEPNCLIIYPTGKDGVEEFGKQLVTTNGVQEIGEFEKFYKIAVRLPMMG